MSNNINDVEVTISETVAKIQKVGSSTVTVANILGTTTISGLKKIYLDRLVHTEKDKCFGPYLVSGAISTILSIPSLD